MHAAVRSALQVERRRVHCCHGLVEAAFQGRGRNSNEIQGVEDAKKPQSTKMSDRLTMYKNNICQHRLQRHVCAGRAVSGGLDPGTRQLQGTLLHAYLGTGTIGPRAEC